MYVQTCLLATRSSADRETKQLPGHFPPLKKWCS